MNKKLVAVAIGGLLAAPLAQAQTANVTLYGRVNMDMEIVNGKQPGGSNPNVFRVSSNSSRFGLKGVEALGGGLSAIFQLESGVSWDTGNNVNSTPAATGIGARESFIGLQGGWGTLKLGNFLSPYDDIHPIWGSVPTLLTGVLATASAWGQATQSNANGGFDNRNPNSVRYDSPIMSGFNASVQYSAGGGSAAPQGNEFGGSNTTAPSATAAPRSNSGIWTLGGFYNNGPAQIGIAYTQNNQIRGVGLTDKALSIAGGWQFTGFRIGAVWERLDYDVSDGCAPGVLGCNNLKRDFWGIGGTINLGPGQMYVSYSMAYDGKGSAPDNAKVGQVIKGNDTGTDQWTISYTFPMSKRTLLYTGYTKISNDAKAFYTFNVNGYAVAPGGDPGGFVLGAVHFF